ncbi:MAG: PAS domain S-box-containing protein [Vicingaceae bacterium]|jgi:PAS domain S-box-containing protein
MKMKEKLFGDKILDLSINGIYVYDLKTGRNIYINKRYTELTGHTLESLNALSQEAFMELFHPDDQHAILAHMGEVIGSKDGKPIEINYRFRKTDGTWLWCRSRDSVFDVNQVGDATQFMGSFVDSTEAVREEQRLLILKEFAELLLHTESLEEVLFNALKSVCSFTNWPVGHTCFPDSDVLKPAGIWYNQDNFEIESLKEVIGTTSYSFGDATPGKAWEERKGVWDKNFKKLSGSKKAQKAIELGLRGAFSLEVPYKGDVVAVLEFFYKNSKDERTEELEEFVVDLQELLLTTIERDNYKKELMEAKKLAEHKSAFLANMVHEIRTPMNAILGHAQILGRDKLINNSQRSSVASINRSGNHLLGLINDILNLSKIETGTMKLNHSAVNPSTLIKDVTSFFELEFKNKEVQLLIEYSEDLPRFIECDENKVKQVLTNLIGNALKFTKRGSILVKAEYIKGFISYVVRDTGVGIPKQDLKDIFGRFEQVKGGLTADGVGLGLAISKNLAELMGGSLSVTSTLGKGTTFTFSIPYTLTEAHIFLQEDMEEDDWEKVTKLKAGQPEVKILVVDDIEENRNVITLLLESIGFVVKTAIDGKDGLAACRKWRPDIVVLDLVMPVMDGIEATAAIRELEYGSEPKIIGISTSAFDEEKGLFINAGANGFVKQPIKLSELLREIKIHSKVVYDYEDTNAASEVNDVDRKELTDVNSLSTATKKKFRTAIVEGDLNKLEELSNKVKTTHEELDTLIRSYTESYNLEGLKKLFN